MTELRTADAPHNVEPTPTVVAIGASAGGLAALKSFFEPVTTDSGLAFVVVVHLAPDHKSQLAELLQPHVKIPVKQVSGTVQLKANRVYIIPPGRNLGTIDTHLRLSEIEVSRSDRAPIDHFFRTLASTHDGNSVGVLLSGTGSDGTLGIKEIKARGGLTVVQDPQQAEYDGMPLSALASGAIDLVLPVAEIAERARRFASTKPRVAMSAESEPAPAEEFEVSKLFAQVRTRTSRDFSRYKHSTVMRRIKRRMQLAQVEELGDYVDKLQGDLEEVRALADDFLITVTSFFRDPEVFEHLKTEILPKLFANSTSDTCVRVWSVGCSTGEEAYSLAMLLLDESARHDGIPSVQVFASDMHEASLKTAREGCYHGDIECDVSEEHLQRYFLKDNGAYRVRKEVRDVVVFAPHNLLSDPPFSKLDLVMCRNLLIYLKRDLQADIIDVFHYALNREGWLILGTAESLESTELFQTQSKSHSFYLKRHVPAPEPRLPVFPLSRVFYSEPAHRSPPPERASYGSLHQTMLERYSPPSILVSPDHKVLHLSERAGRYLRHPGGSLTTNIVKLVREELQIELTSTLHAAKEKNRAIWSPPVTMTLDGAQCQVVMHVRISPKDESDGFFLVIFEERELPQQPDASIAQLSQSMATGSDGNTELVLTRDRLQTVVRQYETGQEDMRAANEELQSANEELRSTMEELETSKEELQSINEELQTVNQENRNKVLELSQLSSDLKSLMAATHIATLFLDKELRIVRFTPQVSEIFNLLATDRGRPLSDLTHRLGYRTLLEDAASVLEDLIPLEREVADDESRWYLVRIRAYRTIEDRIEGVVVTFVDITARKLSEAALRESERRYRTLFESIDEAFCVLEVVSGSDDQPIDFRILETNPAFEKQTNIHGAEGRTLRELRTPYEDLWLEVYKRATVAGAPTRFEAELRSTQRWFEIYAFQLPHFENDRIAILAKEITERKLSEGALRQAADRDAFRVTLADAVRQLGDPIAIQNASCRLIAKQLYAHRVIFCESSRNDSLLPTAQEPDGIYNSTEAIELGPAWHESLRAGRTFVHAGVDDSPSNAAETALVPFGAHLSVPVLKEGRLEAALVIFCATSRVWSPAEIGLAEDAAERTWGAAQHVHAESLRKSELGLREADRKKDEFLAMLSHELRNPLAPIMNSLFVLDHVPAGSERALHAHAVITRQTSQLTRLVDDLLDLSRVTRGELQIKTLPIDFNDLVQKTFEDFRSQFESGSIETRLTLADAPIWIKADQNRLAQVVGNILHNCGKFTPLNGEISVVVTSEAHLAMLRVKDSGIGMTQEFLARMFEPFVQAEAGLERGRAGLGLGLALARRLIERHGGSITASSGGLGQGTEIVVSIPLNPSGSTRSEPPSVRIPLTTRRVLIIEDNADAAESLRIALECAQHEVSIAHDGREGLAKVRELLPDVVLCDLGLPVMDGYEVARAIRADDALKEIRLIALSGYAMPEDRQRTRSAGFDRHLVKPPNLEEIGRILNEA